MVRRLTAIIEREDNDFVALCPELNVAAQARTVDEARKNLQVVTSKQGRTSP